MSDINKSKPSLVLDETSQQPLPVVQDKKSSSSIRTLKEIQQRKHKLNSFKTTTQDLLQQQVLQSQLDSSFHSQKLVKHQLNQSEIMLPPMKDQDTSLIVQGAIRKAGGGGILGSSGSLLRKRSPSDFQRRKSTPVTPKKNLNDITVPNLGDQSQRPQLNYHQQHSFHLKSQIGGGGSVTATAGGGNMHRNFINLSTVQAPHAKGGTLFGNRLDTGGNLQHQLNNSLQQVSQLQIRQSRVIRASHSKSGNGSRQFLMMAGSKSQSRIKERQGMPGGQAWEQTQANQFQLRNAQPQEVLEQLQGLTSQPLGLLYVKPEDLDSTEPLDSFLDSLYYIIDTQAPAYTDTLKTKYQHLATGIRTDQCEDILSYLCQMQARNKFFVDSVQFFTQHINRLGQLESEKEVYIEQIKVFKQEKEELFLSRYDIDKKYQETMGVVEAQKSKEKELMKNLKQLGKMLEDKKEECESLAFRLRHSEDMANMMEPPMSHQSLGGEVNGESEPAGAQTDSPNNLRYQDDKLRGLEVINNRLESELNIMKNALQQQEESKFTDNVDHFVKIQDLFNKVQIENKQLRINAAKIESKLQSKEKLIKHLEGKVTSVLVEKEEQIVKLKSEIVILKNQIRVDQDKFNQKVQSEQEKYQKHIQDEFKGQIQQLEKDKHELNREKEGFVSRITTLQQEYDKFTEEFEKYRGDISNQENENQTILNDLQSKLRQANQIQEQTSQDMQQRIDILENKLQVQHKQLNIQSLKLKFLKESTETLVKQKLFILEDLERYREQLTLEGQKVEDNMKAQNSQGDYLISVKKAVKQAQFMIDIGLQALGQLGQIVEFLKVEEMMQMIIDQERGYIAVSDENTAEVAENYQEVQVQDLDVQKSKGLEELNEQFKDDDIQKSDLDQRGINKQIPYLQDTIEVKQAFTQKNQSQKPHIEPVNSIKLTRFLAKDLQQTERNSPNHESQNEVDRNEEHFMVYCPIELSSILIKILADIFITSELALSQDQLPESLQKLLEVAYQKSDLTLEQEILQKYLYETKQLIEDKLLILLSENEHYRNEVQELTQKLSNGQKSQNEPNQTQINQQTPNNQEENSYVSKSRQAASSGSMSQQITNSQEKHSHPITSAHSQMLQNVDLLQVVQDQLTMDRQRSKDQQRHKSMIQPNLHSPRLKLPQKDSHHHVAQNFQDQQTLQPQSFNLQGINANSANTSMKSARKLKHDELSLLKSEVESLKLTIQEQKQRSKDLQLQLAGKIVELEEKLESIQEQRHIELIDLEDIHKQEIDRSKQGVIQRETQFIQRIQEYKVKVQDSEEQIMKLENFIKLLRSQITEMEQDKLMFDKKIEEKQEEFVIYKENVTSYMRMKVSQRNIIALALESNNNNISMINEAMLKYYLNKCLRLDKDKFRFLNTEEQVFEQENEFQTSKIQRDHSQITVIKLFIEIVDDQENLNNYFRILKNQIRDGTSILYDLDPLYLSINLGQVGLNSNTKLNEYHLLKKKGIQLSDENFMLSILRHKTNPLSFKIIAIDFDHGDEYVLDLSEIDLFEITDGNNYLLERNEPDLLIDQIISNLTLITKDQGIKVLTCEHKVFFINLFQDKYQQQQQQQQNQQQPQQKSKKATQNAKFVDNYTNPSTSSNPNIHNNSSSNSKHPFRNLGIRDQQIKEKIKSQSQLIKGEYSQNLRIDQSAQTEISGENKDSFTQVYNGNQRLGKSLEFKISISFNSKEKAQQLLFEEIRSKQKVQVCFYEHSKEGYIIFSECIKINDQQQILISTEKIQKDGFFIKIHDLRELASEEFFLIKKSNNTFTKMNRNTGLDLIVKEEFRNLVFDLTFAINIPSSQVLLANMAFHQEQSVLKEDQNLDNEESFISNLLSPPHRKRVGQVSQLQTQKFQQQLLLDSTASQRLIDDQGTNILLKKHERGLLLYRNIYIVRCSFEGAEEQEQQSIISFYQKKDQISVEVFLYKDQQKMSIASQVSADDLFGNGYSDLNFTQKILMLDQMMEKLYVLSENQAYHLKVENDAVPMTQIMEQRKLVLSADSNTLSMVSIDKAHIEMKCKEISENKDDLIKEGRAQLFSSYALLNSKVYDYNAYFLLRNERDSVNHSSPRKKQSMLKKMLERQGTNLEAIIEDNLEYDQIFIEISDKDGEYYSTYLNQRILTVLLTQNPHEYKNNLSLVSNHNKEKLVEYLKKHTKIDLNEGITIENNQTSQEKIIYNQRHRIGGSYIKREDLLIKKDGDNSAITKRLIMNTEVDMSEFTYDLKLYLNQESQKQQAALSYTMEIFALNEPDFIYKYYYPIQQDHNLGTTSSLTYDIINLIENPLKAQDNNENISKFDEQQQKKANFQELFSKYIDNRIVLVTFEQLFPEKISFCLLEPSSKLLWSYSFEPSIIQEQLKAFSSSSLDIRNLNLIDQGTLEQYLALLINETTTHDNKQLEIEYSDSREEIWADIGDNEGGKYELIKSKRIGGDMVMKIYKIGSDNIQIKIQIKEKSVKEKETLLIRPQLSNSSSSEELKSKSSMKVMINAEYMNKTVTKLIKRAKQESTLVLICEMKTGSIQVKLIDLESQKVLYMFFQRDSSIEGEQSHVKPNQINLAEAFRSIFNKSIIDETLRIIHNQNQKDKNPNITESQSFNDDLSLTQRRLRTIQKQQPQLIILHRKTFFDESQEKLIIVSVQVLADLAYKRIPLSNTQIPESLHNITQFELLINEPENALLYSPTSQDKMAFKLSLDTCFLEEELQGLNLKDINQLKKLAKIIVEERAIIKRVSNNDHNTTQRENADDQGNVYQIQINLGGQEFNNMANGSAGGIQTTSIGGEAGQSTLEAFEETKKIMEDLRKTNNVSANGKRRQHSEKNINDIAEEEEENEEEGSNNSEFSKRQSPSQKGSLQQQMIATSNTIRNHQHQLLDQSIIEEEASQEENDDSPSRITDQIHHSSQHTQQDLRQQQQQQQQQMDSSKDIQVDKSLQILEDMTSNDEEMDMIDQIDDMNDIESNSSYSQVQRKNIPRDYVIEIGTKQKNGERVFMAKKIYTLDNSIVAQKTYTDDEVQVLLQAKKYTELQLHDIIDLLADVLQDDSQFQ